MTTRREYEVAFERECRVPYPTIDAFEQTMGFAIGKDRLLMAARVLACPVKRNPPNWQHGRVLYALTRRYLQEVAPAFATLLDIGTAKGFSALCFQWALNDANVAGHVVSVDVIDPKAAIARNSIADIDGPASLAEILSPWPEAEAITFLKSTGIDWLVKNTERVHVAFVDGKHSFDAVFQEGMYLRRFQQPEDVTLFDDMQIPEVARAVKAIGGQRSIIDTGIGRSYCMMRKR